MPKNVHFIIVGAAIVILSKMQSALIFISIFDGIGSCRKK